MHSVVEGGQTNLCMVLANLEHGGHVGHKSELVLKIWTPHGVGRVQEEDDVSGHVATVSVIVRFFISGDEVLLAINHIPSEDKTDKTRQHHLSDECPHVSFVG